MIMTNEECLKEILITKEQLATKVKSLRKEKSLSQEDLEECCNISRRNIGYIENAQVDIKLSTLIKLCQDLNVKLSELLNFSDLD